MGRIGSISPRWRPSLRTYACGYKGAVRLPTLLFTAVSVASAQAPGPADRPVPRTDPNSMIAHRQLLEKAHRGGIDVYFEGDSITRRWGATDYPELLANWKQNFFGTCSSREAEPRRLGSPRWLRVLRRKPFEQLQCRVPDDPARGRRHLYATRAPRPAWQRSDLRCGRTWIDPVTRFAAGSRKRLSGSHQNRDHAVGDAVLRFLLRRGDKERRAGAAGAHLGDPVYRMVEVSRDRWY
jgi:hypothetical protein